MKIVPSTGQIFEHINLEAFVYMYTDKDITIVTEATNFFHEYVYL